MPKKYYTGIGSRETPESLRPAFQFIASKLEKKGYILRSGAAEGADQYFESGVSKDKNKEIYLPWEGFNYHISPLYRNSMAAYKLAAKHHPRWSQLSIGARKLHTRNVHQVLGKDLKTPSDFVVCWTKDGLPSGGTGQAIRIAQSYGIQVYNLFNTEDKAAFLDLINT